MRISSWCTPLGGLGNTGRAIHLVHKRNKKRGRLTPSAYQSAIPRILHFLHADVKIKGRKQACSKFFSSRQQIISDSTSRGGECAGAGFTLYLEGYADGQQHHYAVWAARALRERDVQLHGRAAVRHHGSQWRGQVHVYEDFDGGAGFHERIGYTPQANGGFAAGPVCLRRLSRH